MLLTHPLTPTTTCARLPRMLSPVRVLGDRVLVRKVDRNTVRNSGLVLPDTMRDQSDRGQVIEVGPGIPSVQADGHTPCHIPIQGVEVGDTVLFSPYAGSLLAVGDSTFLLLRVGDVLGVLVANESELERQPDLATA